MMGNRGRLHDNYGVIRRLWQAKRWLVGLLEFDGRHRQVMAPDRCTELFFLRVPLGGLQRLRLGRRQRYRRN